MSFVSGEQNLNRSVNCFLREFDYSSIRQLITFLLFCPFVVVYFVVIIVCCLYCVLFHLLYNGSMLKFIFWIYGNFTMLSNKLLHLNLFFQNVCDLLSSQTWFLQGVIQDKSLKYRHYSCCSLTYFCHQTYCLSDREQRKNWRIHEQYWLYLQLIENALNKLCFVLFGIDWRIYDQKRSSSEVNTHQVRNSISPQGNHFLGVLLGGDMTVDNWVLKSDVVFFGFHHLWEFLAEVHFLRGSGIIFWDSNWIACDSVDDDWGIIYSGSANFDSFGTIIDNDALSLIYLAFD